MALAFLIGFLNVGIYNGAYINVCEYVHDKWKNRVCLILLVADSSTVIFNSLYFKFVSNYWLYFQIFGLLLNILGLIGVFFLPESPEYLYSFYRFDHCRQVISHISKWNKRRQSEPYIFDVEDDLRKIRFEKEVADNHEKFRTSVLKGEEHKK